MVVLILGYVFESAVGFVLASCLRGPCRMRVIRDDEQHTEVRQG